MWVMLILHSAQRAPYCFPNKPDFYEALRMLVSESKVSTKYLPGKVITAKCIRDLHLGQLAV